MSVLFQYLLWAFIGWFIMVLINFETFNSSLTNYTRKQAYKEYLSKYYVFFIYSSLTVIFLCNAANWGVLFEILKWFGIDLTDTPKDYLIGITKGFLFFMGMLIQGVINNIRQYKFPVISFKQPPSTPPVV